MKVVVIPPEYVHQRWSEVEPWLEAGFEPSGNTDYTIEHFQLYTASGQWMLVAIEEEGENNKVVGAAAVQFFNRPTQRVAFITAAGGRFISGADVFEQLVAVCKHYGATCIEAAARESVARLWAKQGLTEKHRIVGINI